MRLLFEKEFTFTPEREKTNIILPFEVSEVGNLMKISFSYSPKYLEDKAIAREKIIECLTRDAFGEGRKNWEEHFPLANLLTLSLDDPEGYRGCAHRQAPSQEHIIGEDTASYGFIPGKIIKGEWRAVINVHALVTEKCRCKIKIELGGKENE